MNNLHLPLTEQELDFLEDFLLSRAPEDEAEADNDPGILDISTLDGFLTAVVSGPNPIPPSIWFPAVWGDFEPEWQEEAQFTQVMLLLVRHMNDIATTLMHSPEEFEPLFMEREVEGKTYLIVEEWCAGYLRGISLDLVGWKQGEEFESLVEPILLFGEQPGWEQLVKMTEEMVEQIQSRVAPSVRQLHAYWLAKREVALAPEIPAESKAGRHDLCPCGSGKKFKQCCGSVRSLH